MGVTIKVHDVLHDEDDYNVNDVEEYIESWVTITDVDVRIAPGPKNSPIFLRLDETTLSFENAKRIARSSVTAFARRVDGVNIDSVIRDRNLRVQCE